MPTIQYEGTRYECAANETVLESLERQGRALPRSCRNGVCQTCLVRATEGTSPASAQQGLKETLRAQGYFLACVAKPTEDLAIALPGEEASPRVKANVVERRYLNAEILRLRLRCEGDFAYRAGQFLRLHAPDSLIRSYSLASLPEREPELELHIRRLPGGKMTTWLHEQVRVGDSLIVDGPSGNCFYTAGRPEEPLLLIATGSGLAPLWGIVRDALHQGHQGEIYLYHGSWNPDGLYLTEELAQLAAAHSNFYYVPCVDADPMPGMREGRAEAQALCDHPQLKGWRVYLCGHPGMVQTAKRKAYLAGASLTDIYADPFVLSAG